MLASSIAKPPNGATKATATSSWEVERFTCSYSVIISIQRGWDRACALRESGSLDGLQRLRRTNVDVRFYGEILAERNIEKRPGRFIHAVVFRTLDHADDLRPIAFH